MSFWHRNEKKSHRSGCGRTGWLLLLLLALAPWPLAAQTPAGGNIELLSRLSLGSPQAVAMRGHYAYLAQGFSLLIIDIQDPDHPAHVGSFDLNNRQVRQIVIDGDYAYLTLELNASQAVLLVLDLHDPLRPVLRGSWKKPDNMSVWTPSILTAGNNRLFFKNTNDKLTVFDVSNPDQPAFLYELPQDTDVYQMTVAGSRLYAVSWKKGLIVYDIVTPVGPPQFITTFKLAGYSYNCVAVANGLAYASAVGSGLQIIDISNPYKPVLQATDKTTTYSLSLSLSGQTAWLVNYDGIHLVDVSDPAHPRPRGALASKNAPTAPLMVAGNTGCILDAKGLQLAQADDPDHLRLAGRFAALIEPHDIAMNGSWAYVSDRFAFQAIDLTDPATPRFAGNLPLTESYRTFTTLLPEQRQAWVSWDNGTTGTMRVIDLHDPAHPALQSTINLPGVSQYGRVLIKSPYAYFLAQASGDMQMHILDISDPVAPRTIGVLKKLPTPQDLAVDGDLAYIIDNGAIGTGCAVKIVDISNPAHPVARGSFTGRDPYYNLGGYYAHDLAFANNALFVLDHGLSSYAPAGPATLLPLGHSFFSAESNSDRLLADRNRLLLSRDSELRLFDISQPSAPKLLGDYKYPSFYGYGAAMTGDLITRIDRQPAVQCFSIYHYQPALPPVAILDPSGGESFPNTAPLRVHWKTDLAAAGSAIRLELWSAPDPGNSNDNPSRVADLGSYWSATGEAVSQVTLPLKYTGPFRLRAVSSWDSKLYGETLAPIFLSGSTFRFTAPAGPVTWPVGSTQTIAWEVNPLLVSHNPLHFELWRGPAMVADLGTGAWQGDAGSLTIQLPSDLLPGTEYRIQCSDFSYYQYERTATPEITITNGEPVNTAVLRADWALYD